MTGNDIGPNNMILFYVGIIQMLAGALMNANIIGTIGDIFKNINRKT